MAEPPVRPGDILARKYRVERVLGAGAMGVVVAARHVDLGQLVAVKHLLTGKVVSHEQRERFLREARAAVLLKSHHVARVLDVGSDDHDAPYIVMEFLEGQDLAAMLKTRRQLPVAEAVEYVLQACEAVGEAHAAGIVHRDLKPANMFLTSDVSGAPVVKVLDFGISKLLGSDVALTHESQMLGSPLYMSPEQMTAPTSVDARADIWALGIILYQLVAGRTPFHAETIQGVCGLVLAGQPMPLATYRADAPAGFEAVIMRCLARDRAYRFRDVAELAAALAPYAPERARVYVERVARVVARGGRAGSAADLSVSAAPAMTAVTQPLPATQAAMSPAPSASASMMQSAVSSSVGERRGKPWVLVTVGAGAAVVGLAAVGLLWLKQAPSEEKREAAARPAGVSSEVVTVTPASSVVVVAPAPSLPVVAASASASAPLVVAPPLATSAKAAAASPVGKPSSTASKPAGTSTKKNKSLYDEDP